MIILKVDPEFENKIPPLTQSEFEQLRDNILEDGEIFEPIITWNGIIVDGHNRWKILQEHPEIPFKTREMIFFDKWEAFDWMYKKQLGRRNLTSEQRLRLIGQMQESRKKAVTNPSGINQHTKEVEVQNEPQPKKLRSTAEAKSCDQIQDMLFVEKGINWNDYAIPCKRGTCCRKQMMEVECKNEPNKTVMRKKWIVDQEIPTFTQNMNYIHDIVMLKD